MVSSQHFYLGEHSLKQVESFKKKSMHIPHLVDLKQNAAEMPENRWNEVGGGGGGVARRSAA